MVGTADANIAASPRRFRLCGPGALLMTVRRSARVTRRATSARRRRLGQHFLRDAGAIARLVTAIAPHPHDRFCEIGPGDGALTGALLPCVARLVAVELDARLARLLRRRHAGDPRLTLIEADALHVDLDRLHDALGRGPARGRFRVAGNLPYRVATAILTRLLPASDHITDVTCLVQEEVADRLTAGPDTPAYGALSVFVRLHAVPSALFRLRPGAFSPPPAVNSKVVRFALQPAADPGRRARAVSLARAGFSSRRKRFLNALAGSGEDTRAVREAMARLDLPDTLRAQQMPAEAFLALADLLPAPAAS